MRSALGSISKLDDGRYQVAVTTGIDPRTGKQRRAYKNVRGSRRDAEVALAKLLMEHGLSPDDQVHMTVREYAESVFLPRIEKEAQKQRETGKGRYKQKTYDSYESKLRLHILPLIGDRQLEAIRGRDVRMVQDAMPNDAMANEARKVLSAMFKEAVYDELMEANPVGKARPPRDSEYEPEVLDLDEIGAYLKHFRGHRAEMIVLLALGGSYRRGEIAALNAEDIDLKTGKVTVRQEYIETSHGSEMDVPKNRKARTNFLPPMILQRLREIMPSSGPLYVNQKGERVKPASLSQMYERHRDTLPEGVRRVSLKNLRHSSLTLVYDATGSMEQAKGHAGHGNEAVTRRHYVRAHDRQEMATANAMDELLREAVEDDAFSGER